MGGTCCKCYSEAPIVNNENRVDQQLEPNENKPPMHDMQDMQSIPSTSAPPKGVIVKQASNDTHLQNGLKDRRDPTREKLIEFYRVHSPGRIDDKKRINEVLRRYEGRETQLFADLNRKYKKEEKDKKKEIPKIAMKETEDIVTKATDDAGSPSLSNKKIKKESIADESDEDDDNTTITLTFNKYSASERKPLTKIVSLSAENKDLFKIEVTKPHKKRKKKKAIGTALFGGAESIAMQQSHSATFMNRKKANAKAGGGIIARSTSQRNSLRSPPAAFASITRSNTLKLDSTHKANLDKRRQSSLAVRRNQKQRNLPIRINKVWAIFAGYVVDKMLAEREEERAAAKEEKERLKAEKKEAKKEKEKDVETNTLDILDSIINNPDVVDKNNKKMLFDEDNEQLGDTQAINKSRENHKTLQSLEVLAIDRRLFEDAKTRSSVSVSSSSSDSASSETDEIIDVYTIIITNSQFNIVLNNNNIQTSPDMSCALIWCLLDLNKLIPSEIRALGNESDNTHNDPMKERGFHNKQFKLISKCKIQYTHIEYMMQRLSSGAIISRNDKHLHPKHLSYKKRNYVIWDKIFEHLINGTSFNVEEDYLFGALGSEELADSERVVNMLSSLESHWQHRVQVMEHIDDKLNSASEMERDIFYASILSENDNFIQILHGWSIQLTDDRSGVARTALSTLATVLQGLLLCIQFPLIIFDEEINLIEPIYNGIFSLVRNRRLKDMADDAYDTMCTLTDIFAEITNSTFDSKQDDINNADNNDNNDNWQYMRRIVAILESHSNPKSEKHDKAREACIGGIAFLLYGVQQPDIINNENVLDPINEDQNNNNNKAEKEEEEDKTGIALASSSKSETKICKNMQRKYLLNNEEFCASLGNILKYGVTDKSEFARKKAFNLILRLENDALLNNLIDKWDYVVTKKFNNYKKLSSRKNRDRNRSRTNSRNIRRSKAGKKKKKNKNKKFNKNSNNNVSPSPSPSPSPAPAPPQPQ